MASHNVFKWEGMNEFRRDLRNLPEHLQREGGVIVDDTSDNAQNEIQRVYHAVTGNLRRGVVKIKGISRFGASALVKSRAKHANIYEYGTKPRRTDKGANRGSMPKPAEHERMIPIVIKHRRRMFEALKDLVRRAGFQVND